MYKLFFDKLITASNNSIIKTNDRWLALNTKGNYGQRSIIYCLIIK